MSLLLVLLLQMYYLSIDTNEFTYSTEEQTAELILTITDPNGNPLTSINGLNYVTVGDISGFDKKG